MTAVRPGRWRGLVCAFLATSAMGLSGCDTVALISFSEREFQRIETPGFTATGGACSSGIEDGKATLRFVLMADDDSPIRPNETIGKTLVDLTGSDIEFSDSAIFEVPIVENDSRIPGPFNPGGEEFAPRAEQACDDDCRQQGMTCSIAPNVPDSADARRCQRSASIALQGPVQFESDTAKSQMFGVLFENAGSLEGFLPADLGPLFPDWDGDGTAEGNRDTSQTGARASDPTRKAKAALAVMINNWTSAAENARNEGRETLFGLWEFAGTSTATVNSLIDPLTVEDGTFWTRESNTADRARTGFTRVEQTRANVFMAINHVLDTGFAPAKYEQHEKTLLVFVDGPDDMRHPLHTANSVIERASELGVRMFIVHLDASQVPTTMAGSPVHRDDPEYWRSIVDGAQVQQPCGGDADCKNFERCRVPTPYSSTSGAATEISSEGDQYCMPQRDPQNGRFGPIDEYSRIACATDGGYIYVKEASGIRPHIDWMPFAMDGLWKVDTVVDVLQNRNVESDDTYLFQTTMSVTLGGTQRGYNFSQTGEPIATDDGADTRAAIFN